MKRPHLEVGPVGSDLGLEGEAVEERGDDPEARNPTGVLTADERETLRVALERGYFEVPRATTLVEVADELERTDVEVSQQLRRGTGDVSRETDILDFEES